MWFVTYGFRSIRLAEKAKKQLRFPGSGQNISKEGTPKKVIFLFPGFFACKLEVDFPEMKYLDPSFSHFLCSIFDFV